MDIKNYMLEFNQAFEAQISRFTPAEPVLLYDPIKYISSLPSKKLRPFLVSLFLRGYQNLSLKEMSESHWQVCCSLEMLHNFTLIHDDIMDEDDLRRGKATVHKKWDLNTAILGGDGLLALAFKILSENDQPHYRSIVQEFSRAVLTVCEGQALDKQFESREDVTENEYMDMIYKKTASLIEASCIIGGYAGNAPEKEYHLTREFGHKIGMAFQLQDDYLDIFGDQTDLGKDIGSDIQMRKKTLIMIRVMKNKNILKEIDFLAALEELPVDKIKAVLEESGIAEETRKSVSAYTQDARNTLDRLTINEQAKNILWQLADYLELRSH